MEHPPSPEALGSSRGDNSLAGRLLRNALAFAQRGSFQTDCCGPSMRRDWPFTGLRLGWAPVARTEGECTGRRFADGPAGGKAP